MNKSILLSKSDYKFLSEHFEKAIMSDYNKSRLRAEIKQATIFNDDKLPNDVVSLHTEAKIVSTENGKEFVLKNVILSLSPALPQLTAEGLFLFLDKKKQKSRLHCN